MFKKVQIIAFYLPQFHPIKENDEWWGKGFTEWTSVGKAKPLFKGHYQPRVPADLGYYDLRIPEVRQQQVDLAKEAGIYGFCYWHYWFGNGKELLEMPFMEVLKSGTPDFPFCLGWANESWYAKVWDASAESKHILLIEQQYTGEQDHINHFKKYKSAFADKRYIRQDGYPLFLIYQPLLFPDIKEFIKLWNRLIKEEGIAERFYFVANIKDEGLADQMLEAGFDAVTIQPMSRINKATSEQSSPLASFAKRIAQHFTKRPLNVFSYKKMLNSLTVRPFDQREDVIPFIMPNWDHSPRSGRYGVVLNDCCPELFGKHVEKVFDILSSKKNKLVFLKSWNGWGEGNYMEPDLKFGKGYINVLREMVDRHLMI